MIAHDRASRAETPDQESTGSSPGEATQRRDAKARRRRRALSFRGQAEFKSQGNSLIVIARGDCFHRLTWPDAPSSGS